MAGRLALWLTIALLLARGAGDLLASEPLATRAGAQRAQEQRWPDDAARAFAVQFASVYLNQSPQAGSNVYAQRVAGFAAGEIAGELVPRVPAGGPGQSVRSATVAGVEPVDGRHALITVAAQISAAREMGTRLLVVPVARDERGGLVVYDLPSFAPVAGVGRVSAVQSEPLLDPEREQIEDVLGRFFRAYLTGATDELTYLVPPGVRIGAVAGRFALVSPISVAEPTTGARSGDARQVLVTLQARDVRSRVVHTVRYRVDLVRRERWYVATVNDASGQGGAP